VVKVKVEKVKMRRVRCVVFHDMDIPVGQLEPEGQVPWSGCQLLSQHELDRSCHLSMSARRRSGMRSRKGKIPGDVKVGWEHTTGWTCTSLCSESTSSSTGRSCSPRRSRTG
jgi:hypothetical protein